MTTQTSEPQTSEPKTLDPHIRSFLTSEPRYATIATLNRDGSPHQTLIWYEIRDDVIVVNSRVGRRWPANLRADPRATFAVNERADGVSIECVVERVIEGDDALADISNMAHRYVDDEEAAELIAEWRRQNRITFVLRPVRVYTAGEPG